MNTPRRAALAALLLLFTLAACVSPASGPAVRSPATVSSAPSAALAAWPDLLLTKSPTCSCCSGHEAYLRGMGMRVQTMVAEEITAVKDVYTIPLEMRSCHTSTIGRYFVEGHVPFPAIQRLMQERPDIDGISLPGMPGGSPGMGGELQGLLVVYAIDDGQVVGEFGSF